MLKKLPAAAVGAVAAGLTMPFAASVAEAAPAPATPQPLTGSASTSATPLSQATVITASRSTGQFVQPLTGTYTFSTGYGPRCSPTPGASSHHLGQDLVAPDGTPFRAVAAGTVVSTQDGTSSRAGHVMIRHNIGGKTYHSRYLHVWEGSSHVSTGDTVQAGETIGLVGNSGVASTPHLHLEIWEGVWHSGTALDPHTFLAERGVDMRDAAAGEHFPSQCDDSADSGGSEPAGDSSGSSGNSAPSGETRQVTEGLNLRSGAGNTHSVIGGMAAGEQVTVRSTKGAWTQVQRANGQTGWAHGAYLRAGEGSSSAGSPSSGSSNSGNSSSGSSGSSGSGSSSSGSGSSGSSSSGSSSSGNSSSGSSNSSSSGSSSSSSSGSGDRAQVTAGVNMRSGPSMSSRVERIIAAGSSVEVLSRQGGWHQVRANGNTGWVWEDFLDVSSSSSSSSGSSSSGSSSSGSSSGGSSSGSGSSSSGSSSSGSSSSGSGSSGSSSDSSGSSSGSSSSGSGDRAQVTAGVNMRSGPSMSSRVERIIAAGSSVEVLSRQGGWHQVRANGNTGWVWEDFLDAPSSGSSSSGSGSSSSGSSSGSSSSGSSSSGSSGSSSSGSSSGGSSSSGSSSSGSSGSGSSSSSGRSGPSSGQHRQSSHGPYSSVWDRLAQCESGGNWSINTGNGFYGGLQFSESSWRWVGGNGLPHQASKQEQIERAHQLWQRQGWGAWPSCSSQLGLSGNPGGWGDSYFNVHSGTQTSSSTSPSGQWQASFSVPLREEPSSSADKLAQIPRGAELRTGERQGSWIQVAYDDVIGWVNTTYIASV